MWKELPLTLGTLRDRGLTIMGVWTPDTGLNPHTVFVRWQFDPNAHERAVAEHLIFACKIVHIIPSTAPPDGAPWA